MKDNEYYSRCPNDGCLEVDRRFKSGGRDTRGEEYLNWSMYHADPKQGGCGMNWTHTTKQGAAHDQKSGVNPRWLTRSAAVGRYLDSPSERFRENYALIDWTR